MDCGEKTVVSLAPFFNRIYGALSGHLAVSRESLTSALQEKSVGLRCSNNISENDYWIAELTVNLLARLYPKLAISGPTKHTDILRKLAKTINPNIQFSRRSFEETTIYIGSPFEGRGIYPSASGWVVHINHSKSRFSGPSNPYAAGASAALACAELFRRVFITRKRERNISLSLLDFGTKSGSTLGLEPANLNEVLFAGVGAVGNSALWALSRHSQLRGTFHLVDNEKLELSNLQRYVLASLKDVGRAKAQIARSALTKSKLKVVENELTLQEFADTRIASKIPITVISVDNVQGRRAAQALLPKLIINGWTGDQALGTSWHEFSRDSACLACLYHPHGQGESAIMQASKALGLPHDRTALLWVSGQPLTEQDIDTAASSLGVDRSVLDAWQGRSLGDLYTDVVCGAVPLDVTGVGKFETVPLAHQSALSGILMAAETIKRTQPELSILSQVETLVSWDNVLEPPPRIWTKPRSREKGCICGDSDYQLVYKKKWLTDLV